MVRVPAGCQHCPVMIVGCVQLQMLLSCGDALNDIQML